MKHKNQKERGKRVYEKPTLTTIELAVDEVLFIGCKLAGGGFAWGTTPCAGSGCTQEGS
jgi:hypothetical protein